LKKIEDIRKSYQKGKLELENLDPDPIEQFLRWWNEAVISEIVEPNAMTLATVDKHGQPSARIVLLKGVTHDGFEFYTNYLSDKANDIADNPKVALVFLWKELERQVRIEGVATKLSREKSESYFHSRPRGSQIGALASPQSQVIPDRKTIEDKVDMLSQQLENIDLIHYPEFWGGYIIEPHLIEFWQGRPSRLHDRICYEKVGDVWRIFRLYP